MSTSDQLVELVYERIRMWWDYTVDRSLEEINGKRHR